MNTFCHLRLLLLLALLVSSARCEATASASYNPAPFSAYQPILDRMPFGPMAAAVEQAVDPVQAQTEAQLEAEKDKVASQINMSCVNITPDGATAVGFTDNSVKPPVYYYLRVGESSRSWTVLAADYDKEWADIEKDGVAIRLKLGSKERVEAPPAANSAKQEVPSLDSTTTHSQISDSLSLPTDAKATDGKEIPLPRPAPLIFRQTKDGLMSRPALAKTSLAEALKTREEIQKLRESGGDVKSYMARLQERKIQESAEKAAAEQAAKIQLQELAQRITADELKKRERELNLRLIEQGARPLSDIELTAEEEAALISKGVLGQ